MFTVFISRGDGNSYPIFSLIGICTSIENAQLLINRHRDKTPPDTFCLDNEESFLYRAHCTISSVTNYTYIGKRDNCHNMLEYGQFGGYIIERLEVDSLVSGEPDHDSKCCLP